MHKPRTMQQSQSGLNARVIIHARDLLCRNIHALLLGISLVDWLKHVKCHFFFFFSKQITAQVRLFDLPQHLPCISYASIVLDPVLSELTDFVKQDRQACIVCKFAINLLKLSHIQP